MARVRISTTVDSSLLAEARRLRAGLKDAALVDEALQALVGQHRDAEISAAYVAAYTAHPDEEPDEWGDLVSWGEAVRDGP